MKEGNILLQLVMGTAGTGKTTYVKNEIQARAAKEECSILLVPEQYSWQAENNMFRLLGDANSRFVEVYSFSKLARVIEARYGGGAVPVLNDAARNVLVRRAIDDLGDEIQVYKRHRKNGAFCEMCTAAIKEMKLAGIEPFKLMHIAKQGGDNFKKLSELALIYAEYEAKIYKQYTDEETRLSRAAEKLEDDFFVGKKIFLDGFEGFTSPEIDMLKRILPSEKGCVVTLTFDATTKEKDEEYGLFSHTKKTVVFLKSMANQLGIPVENDIVLSKAWRFKTEGLANLDKLLREEQVAQNSSGLFVTQYTSVYEEVLGVLAQMRFLAVEEGARYNEMAIVCRDMKPYKTVLQKVAKMYGVPVFIDDSFSIEYTAPIVLIRATLSIAHKGLNTADILRLLKTGILQFSREEIMALENYVFTWQIEYATAWNTPFAFNPSGFSSRMSQEEQQELDLAEHARKKIISALTAFLKHTKKTNGKQLAKEIYLLLDKLGAPATTTEKVETLKQTNLPLAQYLQRVWDSSMNMLNEMVNLTGDYEVSAKEFEELFLLFVRSSDIGSAPQGADQAIFATANRMRLAEPKYVFVLGMGEGQFPALSEGGGLLSYADRELIETEGIEMQGAYLSRARIENLFFYKALTAASNMLYISYSEHEGELQTLTASIAEAVETLQIKPMQSSFIKQVATPATAMETYAAKIDFASEEVASLRVALQTFAPHEMEHLQNYMREVHFTAHDLQTLKKIIGKEIRLSPTRAERYFSCPFSYYLQYVLRIKARRKAELSPLESGNFIHYIMEQVLSAGIEEVTAYHKDILTEKVDALTELYIAQNMQGDITQTQRFQNLLRKLKKETVELLLFVIEEQKQSDFHPIAYELDIGKDAKPLLLTANNGERIWVTGKIDRLDVMEKDGKRYIRVIDYKTGTKEFSLNDVYYGLNTQMLIYLFTLCKTENSQNQEVLPAGVLYLLGDSPPTAGERTYDTEATKVYKTDGIVLNDELVLEGMDKSKEGLFIPVKYKNGEVTKGSQKYLASLEKMGNIEQHIEKLLTDMASDLLAGEIEALPVRDTGGKTNPCQYCSYINVCRHRDGVQERMLEPQNALFEQEVTA